jgi:hypothetical protein
MTETNQNFAMFQGNSLTLGFDVEQDGEPVDLTGATIDWVAARRRDREIVLEKEGDVDEDPTTGRFTVELDPEDTEDLLGRYWHEARLEDSAGEIFTVTTGLMTVNRSFVSVE